MLLEDANTKLGVPYLVDCIEAPDGADEDFNTKCVMDIVTITDFKTPPEEKVQVFIAGSLNGDERLSSQIAYYLIEYLVSNFSRDVDIT